jgi:CRP-like cAMP-binding protein
MKGDSRVIGALTQCPLFYGRPIHALVPTCTVRHYADGEPLYRPGDNASHLVVLLTGRAELLDAAEQVVLTYRAPESFGETGLFARHRRRHVTARAVGDVEAVLVPRDALLHAAAADVVINERLLTAVADAAEPTPPAQPDPNDGGSAPRRPRPRPAPVDPPLDI